MANYAVVKNGVVENVVLWDGVTPFSVEGAELIEATPDTRMGGSWDGNVFTFVEPDPGPDTRPYDEQRKSEYPPIDELVVALWEGVVEERMASITELEAKRQGVKTKYPK